MNLQNLISKSIHSFSAKNEKILFENLVSDGFDDGLLINSNNKNLELYKENNDLNLNN